ncbi:MAG: transposase, partial [Microcoleaceae cyanobacterium]
MFKNPKTYRRMSKRLKHLQRQVSKKVKGSNNRQKAVKKLAKIHGRIANIRKD